MKKETVISHFGSMANVARALGVARSSVSGWGELIPEKRAARIERLTNGVLQYDPSFYEVNGSEKNNGS